MAKHFRSTHVRLRRVPGDRRLHVTSHGTTTSGYLAESGIQYTSDDVPILHLEMEESEHDLLSDGTDAARMDISARRVLAVDAEALGVSPADGWAWQQLARMLTTLYPWLGQSEPPPCGHEDVVEVPELGSPTVPGICMWCPAPLVKLNDEWIPA